MGSTKDLLKSLTSNSLSRRSFMKGTLALGAAASLYGCTKEDTNWGGEMI